MQGSQEFISESRRLLLQEYLPKIERCLQQLDDERIWWRANPQSNSIGNLVLHLCGNIRQWIISGVGAAPDRRKRQEEFDERRVIPGVELVATLRQNLIEVDGVLANLDATGLTERRNIQGFDVSILQAIYHAVEHFSMHTGQIIFITKLLTGKDMRFYDMSGPIPQKLWMNTTAG